MSSKYGAVKTKVDGITFASKREAQRYCELKLAMKAGQIDVLTLQPVYKLVVNGAKIATYIGDFLYRDNATGLMVLEDVKGVATPVYRLKKKLMRALYGIEIREVK